MSVRACTVVFTREPSVVATHPLSPADTSPRNLSSDLPAPAVHGGAPGYAYSAGREDRDCKLMKQAVDEAYRAAARGDGGPFGAVILRDDGAVVASRHNLLAGRTLIRRRTLKWPRSDRRLGRLDLSDCEIYASCEPCPMCFALIRTAKIKKVVYGAKTEAAVAAGFDASIPDAFVEYYWKSEIEDRQVEGEAARIAEQVFEKAWEAPDEAMRRLEVDGLGRPKEW
ncbi:guanine deaminase-like [Panicum miliaceum]|uniref:Guanine deaminase-like n=1 Tax=Panicum miliaceum TaxID=4540 RepID=A0A3L6T8F3_PANMI|nr:guanine deaminase-like [Panicum miliaceum]